MGKRKSKASGDPITPQAKLENEAAQEAGPTPVTASSPAASDEVELDATLEDEAGKDQGDELEHALELAEAKKEKALVTTEMVEEEERMVAERAAREQKEELEWKAKQRKLSQKQRAENEKSNWDKLMELLNRSKLYTDFIVETLEDEKQIQQKEADGERNGGKAKRPSCGARRNRTAPAMHCLHCLNCPQPYRPGSQAPKKRRTIDEKKADDLAKATIRSHDLVPLMATPLKNYQIEGVRWIMGLYRNGINGILADQMGLGKTIQTIAFLSHLKSMGMHGPFIVIAPLSTLANWLNEFKTHCPAIRAEIYHGKPHERIELRKQIFKGIRHERVESGDGPGKKKMVSHVGEEFPVLITSYETCMVDTDWLRTICWKFCVVDEAHRLKNSECKLLKKLKELQIDNKLLLSGTPLQNSLPELWSLLHFCLPEVFTNLGEFESWFDFGSILGAESMDAAAREIAEKERRNEVISKLHTLLQPFILRRMKSDVELYLPKKREILLWAQMKPKQLRFDASLREKELGPLLGELATKNGAVSKMGSTLNNLLMQMRKNCNHPDLLDGNASGTLEFPPAAELEADCGKMALLARLLKRLKAGGHRTLVFSQMTNMLDIFEAYLEETGVCYCRLDGSTKYEDRRARIEDFNDPKSDCSIFLLSTRAGGLGINLTSADTVIIYDSDWNPHVDLQAMDRVHRIGQEKPVHIYRLATAHSVEGRMLKRAQSKLLLEKVVMAQGGFNHKDKVKLNASELVQLFSDDGESSDEAFPQSADISDKDLDKLMCRDDMLVDSKVKPPPSRGKGYEVMEDKSSKSTLLATHRKA